LSNERRNFDGVISSSKKVSIFFSLCRIFVKIAFNFIPIYLFFQLSRIKKRIKERAKWTAKALAMIYNFFIELNNFCFHPHHSQTWEMFCFVFWLSVNLSVCVCLWEDRFEQKEKQFLRHYKDLSFPAFKTL
jgi:hypothetical protein